MKHEESNLQIRCVSWFRGEYPELAMLLTHPINEGSGHTTTDRRRQGIHKAEGAVAGVPDLILFLPAEYRYESGFGATYTATVAVIHSLGIEFKTPKGKQSQQQKDFQKMFEAAENKYRIVRSFDQFEDEITEYLNHVKYPVRNDVASAYKHITKLAEQREREKFYRVIGKK